MPLAGRRQGRLLLAARLLARRRATKVSALASRETAVPPLCKRATKVS